MKKQDFPDNAGTAEKLKLPTVRELAEIAALVFPVCTGRKGPPSPNDDYVDYSPISREQEVMQVATRLWLWSDTYCREISKAARSHDRVELLGVAGQFDLLRDVHYLRWLKDNALIGFDAIHNWVRENATAKKDIHMTREALENELKKFGVPFDENNPPVVTIKELRELLTRRRSRRSQARKRRREARKAGQ